MEPSTAATTPSLRDSKLLDNDKKKRNWFTYLLIKDFMEDNPFFLFQCGKKFFKVSNRNLSRKSHKNLNCAFEHVKVELKKYSWSIKNHVMTIDSKSAQIYSAVLDYDIGLYYLPKKH